MAETETNIDGLKVELEIDDGVSQCLVSKNDYHFSCSLAMLEDTHFITNNHGGANFLVQETTIKKISEWAAKNGY